MMDDVSIPTTVATSFTDESFKIIFFSFSFFSLFQLFDLKTKNHRRKSISGNWKTNLGSAMLEQTAMTEKYRSWIEAVSSQFGGLDLCALEVLVARDGREIIMELNDCALPLLGDSQEEDRRLISELVLHRMNVSHTHTSDFFI